MTNLTSCLTTRGFKQVGLFNQLESGESGSDNHSFVIRDQHKNKLLTNVSSLNCESFMKPVWKKCTLQ